MNKREQKWRLYFPVKQQSRSITQYFNTSTRTGKRNIILCGYVFGFLGLHWVWRHSKGFKRKVIEDEEDSTEQESKEASIKQ